MFLLVSEQRKTALETILKLSEHGFFICYSPFETAAFLCKKQDTGGVIVDCVQDACRGDALCEALLAEYPALPIGALIAWDALPPRGTDPILWTADEGYDAILHFLRERCRFDPGRLSTRYLTLDPFDRGILYMGYPLRLTLREHRILYCLLYRAPQAVSAEELCALCPDEPALTPRAIRVYVHRINQGAAKIAPNAPPLVCYRRTRGFFIVA